MEKKTVVFYQLMSVSVNFPLEINRFLMGWCDRDEDEDGKGGNTLPQKQSVQTISPSYFPDLLGFTGVPSDVQSLDINTHEEDKLLLEEDELLLEPPDLKPLLPFPLSFSSSSLFFTCRHIV